MKTSYLKSTIILALLLASFQMFSQISLPTMFTDNMVIQQKSNNPIWGKAKPNSKVTVKTSWNNKEYIAESDKEGNWKTAIETPSAGGPYTIKISNNRKSTELKNVMVGEVWICSGQSNMEWPVGDFGKVANYEEEIRNAKYPNIRLLQVEKNTSDQPLQEIKAAGNGWQECSPETIDKFSATAYFFGRNLHENLDIPIGLINTSWGGTVAEAWTSEESLSQLPEFVERIEDFNNKNYANDPGNPNHPTTLYNAMIAPIVPYGIKGAIWYQGESNDSRAYQYQTLFPLMISDWRTKWGYDFPFYYVQLANFMEMNDEPVESNWAELREAQLKTLNLDNTGMAVIIDIGDAKDIHPKNKQDVGKRLALQALENTYNQNIVGSGPIYQSYKIENGGIRIYFEENKSKLKVKGNEIKGFSIAGPDKKFYWADAKIENNEVVVSSPHVKFPMAVRYAWSNNPECNLYNDKDLPASPFRTDDWPGLTVNNK